MENKTKKTRYERTIDMILITGILIVEIATFTYVAKRQKESVRLYERYEQVINTNKNK